MSGYTIPVIGIVGSIGSGKSAVAKGLAARFDGLHLDADRVGHELLLDPAVVAAIRDEFGSAVISAEGEVDRRALAQRVFGNGAELTQRRQRLESILHPRIREAVEERIAAAAAGGVPVVLLDAAVMLEAGWDGDVDALLCIDAPRQLRLQRVTVRGWDEQELSRREATQLPLEEKRRRADLVVDNSCELSAAIDFACEWITRKFPQLRSPVLENRG